MIRIGLRRLEHTDDGTFGVLLLPTEAFSYTLELPWRDNRPNLSCIPLGTYVCRPRVSPRFGKTYHVKDVEGRLYILIHAANLAGDIERGKKTHLKGCITVGNRRGWIGDQRAVLNSQATLTRFESIMDWQPFELVVEDESCGN